MFNRCVALESINLPPNLTTIKGNAFANCSKLATISIPATVTTIDAYAFNNNNNLKSIKMLPTTPPTIQSSSFNSLPSDVVFTVPKGSLEAYRTATNWVQWADHMVEVTQ